MAPYLQNYCYSGNRMTDVVIDPSKYKFDRYSTALTPEDIAYMESGVQFHSALLKHNGLFLHASAIAYQGKAYLFSANSGTGKSTHTGLWQKRLGNQVCIFNDDKPSLRFIDGVWYAYGSPWCGKDHININVKVPLAGICFLKQGTENAIRRLNCQEAVKGIFSQTIHRFRKEKNMDLLLANIDSIVRTIPVFELVNRPDLEAATISFETMRCAAEEMGL